MQHDLIHIQGKPYALVPLHEYRVMNAKGNSGDTEDLPQDLLDALYAKQEHPVKIMRKYRGMTQKELAENAAISRPYLTEIETGKKNGSIAALKSIADALQVNASLLL